MTEKLYRENQYLRELTAKVIEKKYDKGSFHVVLNRTIFYPHLSGGQPRDKGTINDVEVIDVYERNNDIVHVVQEDIIGDEVVLKIDWNTRFTHMQQHTGQHILSTVFSKLYNGKTVGFHLGNEFVYIDITLPELSVSDLERIENFANKIVFSNFDVKSYYIENDEIQKLPLRKQPTVDSNIRIVEIDGIDYTPCGGTHVRSTGEVGLIKIRKWEKYKGNIRVEFVCGKRALVDYRWKNTHINSISTLLSVKDNEAYDGVKRIFDENKKLIKEIYELKSSLLRYEINDLMKSARNFRDVKIISNIFTDKSLKDVRYMVTKMIEECSCVLIVGTIENNKCQLILSRSSDIDIDLRKIFSDIIGIINGKGGGNSQMVQGGGPRIEKLEKCVETGLNLIEQKLVEI